MQISREFIIQMQEMLIIEVNNQPGVYKQSHHCQSKLASLLRNDWLLLLRQLRK